MILLYYAYSFVNVIIDLDTATSIIQLINTHMAILWTNIASDK